MATSRPFAYNIGSTISGTQQFGNIAIGSASLAYQDDDPGGIQWWIGPDEDLGYIITYPVIAGDRPTPTDVSASLGFKRSNGKTDNAFINVINNAYNQSFTTGIQAYNYLSGSGIWTNWIGQFTTNGLVTNYNLQTSSYGGSGTTITDTTGINNGLIVGSIPYTSGGVNYFIVSGSTSNYIRTTQNLNSSLSPANTSTVISVFVWINPSTNGVIISEQGTTNPDTLWYDSQIQWINGTPCFATWPYPGAVTPRITSNISASFNQWHYVGFVYNGSTLTAYVNGQVAGTSISYVRQTPYNNGGNLGLYYTIGYPTSTNMATSPGGTGLGPASNFKLGAFNVYNNALSATEVLNNYNATKTSYGL